MKKQILLTIFLMLFSVGLLKSADYNRKDYPHWQRQSCNTRTLVLLYHNETKRFSGKPCKIERGLWFLKYSDKTETNPSKIDIDHIIPLKYAHKHGAKNWTKEEKRTFANDMQNLAVTSQRENRSKGYKGPSEYLPPKNVCWYIEQWLIISEKYDLELSMKDFETITKELNICMNRTN